jgi:hypothetical protein
LYDERTDARNLLLVYRLGAAVAQAKARLKGAVDTGSATADEVARFQYFRYGSFAFVVVYVCSAVLGLLLRARDDLFVRNVVLREDLQADRDASETLLARLAYMAISPIQVFLSDKDAYQVLKTQDGVKSIARHVRAFCEQVNEAHPATYEEFRAAVELTS